MINIHFHNLILKNILGYLQCNSEVCYLAQIKINYVKFGVGSIFKNVFLKKCLAFIRSSALKTVIL